MHYYYPGYMNTGYGMGFGLFHFFGGVLTFLFWFIVVILLIRFIRRRKILGDGPIWTHHSGALDILKERYAKGEINKAEYEEKKKDLEA